MTNHIPTETRVESVSDMGPWTMSRPAPNSRIFSRHAVAQICSKDDRSRFSTQARRLRRCAGLRPRPRSIPARRRSAEDPPSRNCGSTRDAELTASALGRKRSQTPSDRKRSKIKYALHRPHPQLGGEGKICPPRDQIGANEFSRSPQQCQAGEADERRGQQSACKLLLAEPAAERSSSGSPAASMQNR